MTIGNHHDVAAIFSSVVPDILSLASFMVDIASVTHFASHSVAAFCDDSSIVNCKCVISR